MTDREKAFLTMAMMSDADQDDIYWLDIEDVIALMDPNAFPMVASTLDALTIERPELRVHYDRVKKAWEVSQ